MDELTLKKFNEAVNGIIENLEISEKGIDKLFENMVDNLKEYNLSLDKKIDILER